MSFGNWMMTFLQNINTKWGCLKQVSFCSLLWKRLGNTIVVSWKEHSLEPGIQTALWFIAIWLGKKKWFLLIHWKKIEAIFRKEVLLVPITKYSEVSITISKGVSLLLYGKWNYKLCRPIFSIWPGPSLT